MNGRFSGTSQKKPEILQWSQRKFQRELFLSEQQRSIRKVSLYLNSGVNFIYAVCLSTLEEIFQRDHLTYPTLHFLQPAATLQSDKEILC
jgi:hypothetical protein